MQSPPKPSSDYIQTMFDGLANRYDLFNHLTSMGMAGLWRAKTLDLLSPGMRVLDIGCGTGDLSIAAIQRMGNRGEVIGLDFSRNMLDLAKKRAQKIPFNGPLNVRWIQKRAEELPIESEPYDVAVSGFVLRNLYENIDLILKRVYQCLKKNGRIRFLDITEPENFFQRFLWTIYMNTLVGIYGKILFGKNYPVLYLTDSAKRFFRARDFVKKLGEAGFRNVQTKSFILGSVTLYMADKES